jgi:hypothetical protein
MTDCAILYKAQGGRCPICARPIDLMLDVIEDHCHLCGRTRGLLHAVCNSQEWSGKHVEAWDAYRTNPPALRIGLSILYIGADGYAPWPDGLSGDPECECQGGTHTRAWWAAARLPSLRIALEALEARRRPSVLTCT